MSHKVRVAVYGTLKRLHHNHRLLVRAPLLAIEQVKGFKMYSLGGFPACVADEESSISIEVYEVTHEELEELDRLEGYRGLGSNNLYDRSVVSTSVGDALIYVAGARITLKEENLITSGIWE